MLLRNRLPALENYPAPGAKAFEPMEDSAVALVRWLNANRVDYVLVGAAARIAHGQAAASGPVTIVPAPYGRNLDRLARALGSVQARARVTGELSGPGSNPGSPALKLNADSFVAAERLALRCEGHDLDVEARPAGVPRYQELFFESTRVELAEGVSVEVASPEHIEHYEQLNRTGSPEIQIRVTRAVASPSA